MHRYMLAALVCAFGFVAAATVGHAQNAVSSPPASAAPVGLAEGQSLFDQAARQFQIGGRISDVNGDPARFQRYQDIRDGILFTDARYAREGNDGAWLFKSSADNLGWRDQRYGAEFERPGRFRVTGLWDSIPQFYSVDTKTPYQTSLSPLLLDDATQRANQTSMTPSLNPYVSQAQQFDLIVRRDVGSVYVLATPTPQLSIKSGFRTISHSGELPWGAGFGFPNDVEVALPYDSRTNDFNVGAEWTNTKSMLRVGYDGSWFNNEDQTLVWDSPLRLDDSTSAPGRGQMSLWPTNSANTISAAGSTKFARRTQLTGFLSYGIWNNNENLLPFTINSTLQQFALPRATAEAKANVVSTNLNLTSRPVDDWRFAARYRIYDYNNEMPATPIPQFINYDTSVKASTTGGPELYAHSRTTFDADATWSALQPFAVTFGYGHNGSGYDHRIFESTGENVFRVTADAVGNQWLTFRAGYEFGDRSGSGLDEQLLIQIGEQPAMRHYDLANRTRNRVSGQVDVIPNDLWTFSASTGFGRDDYDDSYFGLQESTSRTVSVGADFREPNGFGGGATYNFEHYAGFQQSRTANPGQETDPNRDWTADSTENVHYFSIYAMPPKFGQNTEARVSYDFSHAEGNYLYGVVPGGPVPVPSQLPNVFNKLQQFHVDIRHRLSNRLVANVNYLYEPFRVYDFAFDPTVVNGIAQPSSLVLGYVYRPYTANAFNFALRYYW